MIELVAAPLLMVAPFALGFGGLGGILAFGLGALLMALAVSGAREPRTVPLSAHVGFDYAIAAVTILTGLGVGIAGGHAIASAFLVGFGAAHMALAVTTRYSARGA
ncbi:MAG: hypothetical protein U0R52_01845 [Solirubrobacterales bacterium]